MVAQGAGLRSLLAVGSGVHAAFASGDGLPGMERKGTAPAQGPDMASVVQRAERAGTVLNHLEAMLTRLCEDRLHLGGQPEDVDRHHGTGARCP